MFVVIAQIIFILNLLILIYQDIKNRKIFFGLSISFPFVFLVAQKDFIFNKSYLFDVLFNVSFIIFQLVIVSIYFFFKEKKIFNPIDSKLGLGDIIFLFSTTFIFSRINFILFIISGLLFSIILFLLCKFIQKRISQTIPLVGFMSIYLIIIYISSFIIKFSFFKDINIYS